MWHFADFTSLYVFHHIPELSPLNIHVDLISNQHYHSHNLGQQCKVSNRGEEILLQGLPVTTRIG